MGNNCRICGLTIPQAYGADPYLCMWCQDYHGTINFNDDIIRSGLLFSIIT